MPFKENFNYRREKTGIVQFFPLPPPIPRLRADISHWKKVMAGHSYYPFTAPWPWSIWMWGIAVWSSSACQRICSYISQWESSLALKYEYTGSVAFIETLNNCSFFKNSSVVSQEQFVFAISICIRTLKDSYFCYFNKVSASLLEKLN